MSGFGSLLHEDNDDHASLDIYKPIIREASLQGGRLIPIYPISMTSSAGPFEFSFPDIPGQYIHFPSLRLFVEGKVTKADGSNIDADPKVTTVDNFIASLFESCHVDFNGIKVNALSTDHFHFKNFCEVSLSYSRDALSTQLKTGLKVQDTAGKHLNFDANGPLDKRKNFIKGSKTFQGYTFVAADFMSMDRLIPSSHKISMKLYRAKDDFSLIKPAAGDDENYKIEITNIKLYVRYLEVNPSIVQRHLTEHKNKPQLFPIVKSELKTFQVAQGSQMQNLHNIYRGNLPKTVLVLLMKTADYTPNMKKNPFTFPTFQCNHAALTVNGKKLPYETYTPSLPATKDGTKFMREYRTLFDELAISYENTVSLFISGFVKNFHFMFHFRDI